MNFQSILDEIVAEVAPQLGAGKVANYIPALAKVPPKQFGIALSTIDGLDICAGDASLPYSIQSQSKVLSLTLALEAIGTDLWQDIGREPSGSPFNSLIQLEQEHGKPRNPFINAGALCVADRLVSMYPDPKQALLDLCQRLCGDEVSFDTEVAQSEREAGFRNAALANFIKSFGNIENDVDTVLDVYFHQCSIALSCVQMARAMGFLANEGRHPRTGEAVVNVRQARRINALMLTCGTYDAAGEFAFRIGLPCKSGVGGGIVAVVPKRLTLSVWSPALDEVGNSVAGRRALELFVAKSGLSIF